MNTVGFDPPLRDGAEPVWLAPTRAYLKRGSGKIHFVVGFTTRRALCGAETVGGIDRARASDFHDPILCRTCAKSRRVASQQGGKLKEKLEEK